MKFIYHDNNDKDYKDPKHTGRNIFECEAKDIVEADKLFTVAHPDIDIDKAFYIGRELIL